MKSDTSSQASWATLLLVAAVSAAAADSLTLHVAVNGSDSWSGRLTSPNAARTDGPCASLTGARDAIRRARAGAVGKLGPVTVLIHGGAYRLEAPFVLEPQDSGTAEGPVVFAAAPGERPVFSGGRVITGWRQNGPMWEAVLPEVKAGQWYSRQLFVNGQRRQRARSPNTGYDHIAALLPGPPSPNAKPVARDKFVFAPGDLKPFERLGDVNLVLMHSWETSIHPLKSVDTVSNIVHFTAPLKEWWTIGYWEAAQRYYVENALELLDQPGEWYLNRDTGVLSYWPMPDERLDASEVVAPVLTNLVCLAGNADEGRWVEHVTLKGLVFHHSDWALDPRGNSSTQAAVEVPAAVTVDGARHCAFEGCELAHIGTYGVWVRRSCKDCRVQHNRLFDLGAGGVRVGEANMARTDAAETSRTLVDNNHIFDGGHVFAAGIGIWLAQSSSNRISHNDIHDLLYSGMSLGWNWGLETNRTHHNLVEFNHVHHLGHGVLSDAGLIYCLGVSPGSIIRNNVFHDMWPYSQPALGWGIYLDAQCGNYLVESNLVYNTLSGGLMFNNGGHEHVIRNNVFALSANQALWPYSEKRPSVFRRNIVYLTQGALFIPYGERSLNERLAAKEPPGDWDDNLYWHAGGPEQVRFYRRSFAEWQELGLDRHSRMADPRFRDVAAHDFRLQPGSPALELGFQPLDLSGAGLYGEPAWAGEVSHANCSPLPLPPPPPAPKPLTVNDSFEQTPVGAQPAQAHVSGEEKGASIRVSDERAASGRHSLKITDSKTLQPSWEPHFFYEPHFTQGIVQQTFDVWIGSNALFFTEWRDTAAFPRNVGPSVSFDGAGKVSAAGKPLATVPSQSWVHAEIEAALGKSAPRTFKMTLTPAGGATQTFGDLPMSGADFRELHWLGFSSTATADAVYYLDNIGVKSLSPASASSAPAPDSALIDACQYADAAAAQAAWKPMGATAAATLTEMDGRKVLRLPCNFAGTKMERASWDRKVALDLAPCRGIEFKALCRDASPITHFSIYFQSGEGWYHASFFPEAATGWSTVMIDKAHTTAEGKPAGWGQIKTIRISAWRGKEADTEFLLGDIRKTGVLGADALVAIVRGESVAQRSPEEAAAAAQYAETVARNLQGLDIGCSVLSDLDVTAERLQQAKLVVLPYNPDMPDRVAGELIKYANRGGRLLAFYIVPEKLRPIFKVEGGDHVKAASAGTFATIRFADQALPGAPKLVGQQSWNINALRPVPGASRVLGEWLNDKGQPSGYPAVIASTNSMVMTHVLLNDDRENKRRMLLAMAGYLAPELWQRAADSSLARIGAVGGFTSFDQAAAGLAQNSHHDPRVLQTIAAGRTLRESALQSVERRQFAEAMEQAGAAHQRMTEAFCLAQTPLPGEFRAFWCHSAFGVAGMEWDEAIRRLAENGFTAILPNMLWGGAAFYQSKVLPVPSVVAKQGDQIAQCLAACRKYGLQIHVWKVNWNLGHAAPAAFREKLGSEGRLQANSHGTQEPWLCPSHPANQKLEIESMVEVARNYDVDGIHFDYIRYPDADHCFCAGCRERFARAAGVTIRNWPKDALADGPLHQKWLDWRRSNITAVVRAVSAQARSIRPKIKISAAVFSNWSSDRDGVGQDWKLWCDKGYLDFVCPMDYTPSNRSFEGLVAKQVQWAGRTPCYPGLGVSASSSQFGVDRTIEQILITRRYQTRGFVIFNYGPAESKELLPLLGLGITGKQ